MAGIYLIRNMLTGRCYIGSTIDRSRRWRQHRYWLAKGIHHCTYLQRAWNKYGADAFEFFWLMEATPEELLPLEQYFLDHTPKKYNTGKFARASFRGCRHTDEARQKMREASLGKRLSDATREKLRTANLGKQYSSETRRKVSEAMRGRGRTDSHCRNCRRRGYSWSAKENCWVVRAWHRRQQIIHALCDSEAHALELVAAARDRADAGQPPPPPNRVDLRTKPSSRARATRGRGYSFAKDIRRWRARVTVDGRTVNLGCFSTETGAANAVRAFRNGGVPLQGDRT